MASRRRGSSYLNQDDEDEDLLTLQLSQSQPQNYDNELSVSEEVNSIKRLLEENKATMIQQHDTLLSLVNNISATVDRINCKVDALEKQVDAANEHIAINESSITAAHTAIDGIQITLGDIQRHASNCNHTESSAILKRIETIEQNIRKPRSEIQETDREQNITNSIIISHMTDRDNDEEDVHALFHLGLCIDDVRTKSISRTSARYNRPGMVVVELVNKEEQIRVLTKKANLRYTNEYNEIYIQQMKTKDELRLEKNFNTILRSVPNGGSYTLSNDGRVIRKQRRV